MGVCACVIFNLGIEADQIQPWWTPPPPPSPWWRPPPQRTAITALPPWWIPTRNGYNKGDPVSYDASGCQDGYKINGNYCLQGTDHPWACSHRPWEQLIACP